MPLSLFARDLPQCSHVRTLHCSLVTPPVRYKNGNWEDKDVHDSRTLKIKDYRFPRDYPGGAEAANIFFDRAADILTTVSRHTERSVKA